MINTILFVTVIVLMFVLLALLVVIVMEYRSKQSYNHYMMESREEKRPDDEKAGSVGKREEPDRSIPYTQKGDDTTAKEQSAKQTPAEEDRPQEDSTPDPLFKQYPSHDEIRHEESSRIEAIRQKRYGPFTHQRLVEGMGLSPEEADEFVVELIHQLEEAIVHIDTKIEEANFDEIEHITHGLKGAALNIGSGGVADILVDYNTEMKECKDIDVAKTYQDLLRHAVSDLKIEYSRVA
ncbi:hypothetical protein [Hydrogenimonas sp.]